MEGKRNSLASPFALTACDSLRASSVIFCICCCFPEALKPCLKPHWVFAALNEVTKSEDTMERTLVKDRVKKQDKCNQSWTTCAVASSSLHSRGLGILLRELIATCCSPGLRDIHRTGWVNSQSFEEVPHLRQFFHAVCKHGFAIMTDVRWEMWEGFWGLFVLMVLFCALPLMCLPHRKKSLIWWRGETHHVTEQLLNSKLYHGKENCPSCRHSYWESLN